MGKKKKGNIIIIILVVLLVIIIIGVILWIFLTNWGKGNLQSQLKTAQDNVMKSQQNVTQLKTDLNNLEETVKIKKEQTKKVETGLIDLQHKLDKANQEKVKANNDLTNAKAALSTTTYNLSKTKADLSTSTGKLESAKAGLSTATSNLTKANRDLATAKSDLNTANAELTSANQEKNKANTELTKAKADLLTATSNLAKANADLTKANTELTKANADLTKTKADLLTATSNLAKANADLTKANADLTKANADLTKANDDLTKANADLTKANAELTKAKADLLTATSNLTKSKSELNTAKAELTSANQEKNKANTELTNANNKKEKICNVLLPVSSTIDQCKLCNRWYDNTTCKKYTSIPVCENNKWLFKNPLKDEVKCYDIINDQSVLTGLRKIFFSTSFRSSTNNTMSYTKRYEKIQQYGPVNYWNFGSISFINLFNRKNIVSRFITLSLPWDFDKIKKMVTSIGFKVDSEYYYMNNITFNQNGNTITVSGPSRKMTGTVVDVDADDEITDQDTFTYEDTYAGALVINNTGKTATFKKGANTPSSIDSVYGIKEYYIPPEISGWNVSNVTNMNQMFFGCNLSNQNIFSDPISIEMANITSYSKKIKWCQANIPPLAWCNGQDCTEPLKFCRAGGPWYSDLSKWDVSNVIDMGGMFGTATSFNGDLSGWNVSKVTNMKSMFSGGTGSSFNSDISKWNVSQVTNMGGMFNYASSFNIDISNWNVSQVTNMSGMFSGATSFYQNISEWDVSNVVIDTYDRPFSDDSTKMSKKYDSVIKKMTSAELTAYNTTNCMKPQKFRQVLAGYLSCP
jgi:surface protein